NEPAPGLQSPGWPQEYQVELGRSGGRPGGAEVRWFCRTLECRSRPTSLRQKVAHGDAYGGNRVREQLGLSRGNSASASMRRPAQTTLERFTGFGQGSRGQGYVDLVERYLDRLLTATLDAAQHHPPHGHRQPGEVAIQSGPVVRLLLDPTTCLV